MKAAKRKIRMEETIRVSDLARQMGAKAQDLIKVLLGLGALVTINQSLDVETATLAASEFGFEVEKFGFSEDDYLIASEADSPEDLKPRPPVVTIMAGEKTYLGTLRLGQTTDTYDSQGTVTAEAPWEQITPEALTAAIAAWRELTSQEVPPYSAAKYQGRPLYALARQGLDAPVKEKTISVFDAQVLSIDLPSVTFRVRVSAGVYIRSLVHSLGKRMGCGAVLTALTREASGSFAIEGAHGLDAILAAPETLPERIMLYILHKRVGAFW